jgi:alpha-glucosidase (family GH31 glycosyl hydrolase)
MGYSVTGTMMMNIFGIPLAGSDICGFMEDTNDELCARWTVLGSFYPFSRNHNNWGNIPQEPYQFAHKVYEGSLTFLDIMRMAIRNKYHLIKYYYTQMHAMSSDGDNGSLMFQPLFFEFPNDLEAMKNLELNVMIGKSLKLSMLTNVLE